MGGPGHIQRHTGQGYNLLSRDCSFLPPQEPWGHWGQPRQSPKANPEA